MHHGGQKIKIDAPAESQRNRDAAQEGSEFEKGDSEEEASQD